MKLGVKCTRYRRTKMTSLEYGTFEPSASVPVRVKTSLALSSMGVVIILFILYTSSSNWQRPSAASTSLSTSLSARTRLDDGTDPSRWTLVWADEFEGHALDQAKWHLETINGQESGPIHPFPHIIFFQAITSSRFTPRTPRTSRSPTGS